MRKAINSVETGNWGVNFSQVREFCRLWTRLLLLTLTGLLETSVAQNVAEERSFERIAWVQLETGFEGNDTYKTTQLCVVMVLETIEKRQIISFVF